MYVNIQSLTRDFPSRERHSKQVLPENMDSHRRSPLKMNKNIPRRIIASEFRWAAVNNIISQ